MKTGLESMVEWLEEEINRYTNKNTSQAGCRLAHEKGLYDFLRKARSLLEQEAKPTAPSGLENNESAWRKLDHLKRHKHPNHGGEFLYAPDVYNELSRYSPEEPKDCGFTLATCPYERCSGITLRKEEPLAAESFDELMNRKGKTMPMFEFYRLGTPRPFWCIRLADIDFPENWREYREATREETLLSARQYLMGLPDKEGK